MSIDAKDMVGACGPMPELALLGEGMTRCPVCLRPLVWTGLEPLSSASCPRCGAAVLVPYLVKTYWLCRPLAVGGMGSVFKALRQEDGMELAVKILPREGRKDCRLVAALLREGKIGAKFGSHPHLVKVVDHGRWGDEHFMATEFCPGTMLDELVAAAGPVGPERALRWGMELLSAMRHMYDVGYLHRDLKPRNVIVDTADAARLLDFGLCMSVEQAATDASETVEGSPQYMPPERLAGTGEDMASEIYSLGMLLFQVLTREPFYSADTAVELARSRAPGPPAGMVAARLPASAAWVADLVGKMIERDPKDRFQSYREALDALAAAYDRTAA